ncbi:MAG: hypothetical protein HYX51_05495 [Chloroflexi bacterium]|nr:hypothetical protein [Chloroflexota bacterium]
MRRLIGSCCLLLILYASVSCNGDQQAEPSPTAAVTSPGPAATADVTVTVDVTRDLGPVVTGGGSSHTGLSPLVPGATSSIVSDLKGVPYRLNRVHFAAEFLNEWNNVDKDAARFPQPSRPPAPWNFSYLDGAVDVARRVREGGGPDFIMSIHNAPVWMSRAGPGTAPVNFQTYAEYCARLVRYYNLGSFVDDTGRTVTNPNPPQSAGKITWWEIWNEPDGNDFGDRLGAVLTPADYAQLFVTVSAAMRAVDPDIKIGGPNTASEHDRYLRALLDSGARVDFIALHQYDGEVKNTDAELFDQARQPSTLAAVRKVDTGGRPLFVSEFNALVDDSDKPGAGPRLDSAFSLAYLPLFYISHVEAGTTRVMRWETVERYFGLFDQSSGARLRTYWVERVFWSAVQEGSRRVACASSSPDIACLALLGPDGKARVVLVNTGVRAPDDVAGPGIPHTVAVAGLPEGSYEMQVVHRDTDPVAGPARSSTQGQSVVTIDGYGMATVVAQ